MLLYVTMKEGNNMKKIIIIVLLLSCCVGCESNKTMSKIEQVEQSFYDTAYGHKGNKEPMTSSEAYALLNDFVGTLYDEIEYYDIVEYALGEVINKFYAFKVSTSNGSYYVLVDIYNGVTTSVTADELNIKE